jgi:acetyl-CoA C-acetyltransferase
MSSDRQSIEIAGVGRTPAAEQWTLGLVDLAVQAGGAALDEAGGSPPTAVVLGNALGGALGDQSNAAAYVADRLGLGEVESHSVGADEASGGAALRLGCALIEAGMHDSALVIGAEKTSDALPDELEAVRAAGLDAMREAGFGFGPAVAAGLGMRRYLREHRLERGLFYHLAETAHLHAASNPQAFFPWELSRRQYDKAPMVAEPMTVCDTAPTCDGAAALLLRRRASGSAAPCVLGASSVSTATGIAGPIRDLALPAAGSSARRALESAGLRIEEIDLFDLHDSNSFLAALSLEAVGLAGRGGALQLARDGELRIGRRYPSWTFGGLKARGNAPGAAGVYQAVEAVLQLRGEAGDNQVKGASRALVQCLGSFGAAAVTHVLAREAG